MLDDTNAQYDTDIGQQLAQGTPVYDVNSDKVGTVADTDQQNNAMIIQKGLFFPKDISVPMSCIARSDADGVYLNISKDDVSNGNFNAAGSQWNRTGTAVDTETPYQAGPARSVGDQPLGDRAAATADQLGNRTDDVTSGTQTGDINVPVREEQLVAEKERGQIGEVHLHKDVTERQEQLNVPVTHEEVTVERVPVDRPVDAANLNADAWQDRDIDVPVMGEQVNTEKRARVAEEVHLQKQAVTENQQVSDTVRREQVHVEGGDNVQRLDAQDNLDNSDTGYTTRDDTTTTNP